MLTFQHKVNNSFFTPMYMYIASLNMHLSGATGNSLYWIVWEAVRRLEEMNLKVKLLHEVHVCVHVCDNYYSGDSICV